MRPHPRMSVDELADHVERLDYMSRRLNVGPSLKEWVERVIELEEVEDEVADELRYRFDLPLLARPAPPSSLRSPMSSYPAPQWLDKWIMPRQLEDQPEAEDAMTGRSWRQSSEDVQEETDDQKAQRLKEQLEFDRNEARREFSLAHLGGRMTQRHAEMADYVDRRIWEGAGCDEGLESGLSGAWMRRLIEKHEKAHQIKNEYWRHVTRARIWKEIWAKVEEMELPRRRRQCSEAEVNMHLFPKPEEPRGAEYVTFKSVGEAGRIISTRWRDVATTGRYSHHSGSKRVFGLTTPSVWYALYHMEPDREVVKNTSTKAKRDV